MNPQPDPIVGQLFAAAFCFSLVIYTIKAINENKVIKFNDNFVIGYIEESPINVSVNNHTVEKIIKTKKVFVEKPSFESQQLYIDCIDVLISLGMKKREARNKAKLIFTTVDPQPTSIQEFLIIALGKSL